VQVGEVTLLTIAPIALSLLVFFLNRQHARSLFEATQYPDFELSPETALWAGGKAVVGHTYKTPFCPLNIKWSNVTKVVALNLCVAVILTRRVRRFREEDQIGGVSAFGSGTAYMGKQINEAMRKLCPGRLSLRSCPLKGGSSMVDWLEVPEDKSPPGFGLVVELRWQAPLWSAKWLKRTFRYALNPQMGENRRIDYWIADPRSVKGPLRFVGWRPRTVHIKKVF